MKSEISFSEPAGAFSAAKPPKPFYTGNWLQCCDCCAHAEPHYCRLYSRAMKNMDIKRCRDWKEKEKKYLGPTPCSATLELANQETVTPCHLQPGHEGDHDA